MEVRLDGPNAETLKAQIEAALDTGHRRPRAAGRSPGGRHRGGLGLVLYPLRPRRSAG